MILAFFGIVLLGIGLWLIDADKHGNKHADETLGKATGTSGLFSFLFEMALIPILGLGIGAVVVFFCMLSDMHP